MKKRTIELTALNGDARFPVVLENTLLLRTARKVGDREVVNNFVYGTLLRFKGFGMVDFKVVE